MNKEDFETVCRRLHWNDDRLADVYFRGVNDEQMATIVAAFADNTAAKELYFSVPKLSSQGATLLTDMLASNTFLRALRIIDNRTSGVLPSLVFRCVANTNLEQLWLKDKINSGAASELYDLLSNNATNLRELHLVKCCMDASIAKNLFQGQLLKQMPLHTLDLNGNKLGDDGARAVTAVLYINRSLRYLSLKENAIGDVGAAALSVPLHFSVSTIDHLDLSYNRIGTVGLVGIAQALETNSTLETLYIERNDSICVEGFRFLSESLSNMRSLRNLRFGSDNPMPDSVVESISTCVGPEMEVMVYPRTNSVVYERITSLKASNRRRRRRHSNGWV